MPLPVIYDFGDAPDPFYPTLMANKGAQHVIVSGYHLGNIIDDESDGQPDQSATGDDTADSNDDDGIVFLTDLIPGEIAGINVTASGSGYLDAWIDFNGNGSWADAGEQVLTYLLIGPGSNMLNFNIPVTSITGNTFARFRFSSFGGLSYDGPADDGDVEDYQVEIKPEETILPPIHLLLLDN